MSELKNKTVVVTGAGRGIGKYIALGFAAAGANVVITDIDQSTADECLGELLAHGVKAKAIMADCSDLAAIDAMFAETVADFGRLDVLVNNAAITFQADIMDITEADHDRVHRINSKGTFFSLQKGARYMIDQGGGGRIINISSIAGRGFAGTSNAAYAATKGGIIALTRIAANQLAKYNITVNAICPGMTLTPLALKIFQKRAEEQGITQAEYIQQFASTIPLKRANTVDDMTGTAVFLATEGARNITGQSINVDGGLVMS
jgi:NAD(P)-dependent dehydrogenase (short-subunit alcohol dehydrogenase family)